MKNKPNKIFLQIGEEPELGFDFKNLSGVTFSTDQIYDNDLVYYSEDKYKRDNAILINALKKIANFSDEDEDEWGDPGQLAMDAMLQYKASMPPNTPKQNI